MKYKLKQDLPTFTRGELFEIDRDGHLIRYFDDQSHQDAGNYFKTYEEAYNFADRIKEALRRWDMENE